MKIRSFALSAFLLLGMGTVSAQLIAPDAAKYKTSVGPMLKTTWGQGAPYNSLCPTKVNKITKKEQHCPVGCVALALGQIMYYHAYPKMGKGRNAYKSFFDKDSVIAEFGKTEYKWEKMLTAYPFNYTGESVKAVATLLFHCGVAVGMIYQLGGSSAFAYSNIPRDMIDYFRYEPDGIRYLSRQNYTKVEWMELIYNELSNGRPIFYSGNSDSQGGHAWVLDGYNEKGEVHINWGWKGKDNGYFDPDLDVDDKTLDFKHHQAMIIGIKPPSATAITAPTVQKSASSGEGEIIGIYGIDGTRRPQLGKGVNIIKYADGSVRKVRQ